MVATTNRVTLSQLHLLPDSPGVYFLWRRRRCVYVGASRSIVNRVGDHLGNSGKRFSAVSWLPVPEGELRDTEAAWINKLKPQYNQMIPTLIEYEGRIYSVDQLAKKLDFRPATLYARLKTGWSVKKATTMVPVMGYDNNSPRSLDYWKLCLSHESEGFDSRNIGVAVQSLVRNGEICLTPWSHLREYVD